MKLLQKVFKVVALFFAAKADLNLISSQGIEGNKKKIQKLNNNIKLKEQVNLKLKQELATVKEARSYLDRENALLRIAIPKEDIEKSKKWARRIKSVNKCDICETCDNLTAHHLWDKKNHPSLRYQDENGVCLCQECHNGFHKQYTNKSHVTPAMYQKYKIQRITHLRMGWS